MKKTGNIKRMFLVIVLSLALIAGGLYAVFVNMVRMTLHPAKGPFYLQVDRGLVELNLLGARFSIAVGDRLPAALNRLKLKPETEKQ